MLSWISIEFNKVLSFVINPFSFERLSGGGEDVRLIWGVEVEGQRSLRLMLTSAAGMYT